MVRALLGQVKDQSAFDGLAQIALSPQSPERWRRSALEALREFRNPLAIPVFIQALDSQDARSQHLSVLALAEITGKGGKEYGPGWGIFQQDPRFSIQNWKLWWQEDGRRYYEARKR